MWIGSYKRDRWKSHYVHNSLFIDKEKIPEIFHNAIPASNTQSTTYIVGELFVHVLSSSIGRDMVRQWKFHPRAEALLTQIWPVREPRISWPRGGTMLDLDAHHVAEAFYNALLQSIRHKPTTKV